MTTPIKYPLTIDGISENRILRPDGHDSKWARVILECRKKDPVSNAITGTHRYAAVVNCETQNVYRDDEKSILAIKFFGLAIYTPIALVAKTIYHILFPISIPHQIYLKVNELKEQEAKIIEKKGTPAPREMGKRVITIIARNMLDIVKTPLYAVAMTVVALGTLILSIFRSQILYDGRTIFGKIMLNLNYDNKKSVWLQYIAPCMQPMANLKTVGEKRNYFKKKVAYDGERGSTVFGLNNLVKRYTKYFVGKSSFYTSDWLNDNEKALKGERWAKCCL